MATITDPSPVTAFFHVKYGWTPEDRSDHHWLIFTLHGSSGRRKLHARVTHLVVETPLRFKLGEEEGWIETSGTLHCRGGDIWVIS